METNTESAKDSEYEKIFLCSISLYHTSSPSNRLSSQEFDITTLSKSQKCLVSNLRTHLQSYTPLEKLSYRLNRTRTEQNTQKPVEYTLIGINFQTIKSSVGT